MTDGTKLTWRQKTENPKSWSSKPSHGICTNWTWKLILLAINIVREIMNGLERLKTSTFPHSEFLCLFMLGKEYHAIHGDYVFGVIFCYVTFALVVHGSKTSFSLSLGTRYLLVIETLVISKDAFYHFPFTLHGPVRWIHKKDQHVWRFFQLLHLNPQRNVRDFTTSFGWKRPQTSKNGGAGFTEVVANTWPGRFAFESSWGAKKGGGCGVGRKVKTIWL